MIGRRRRANDPGDPARRAALVRAAEALFEALDQGDLEDLLSRFRNREELGSQVVDRAEDVIRRLAEAGEPVAEPEYPRLVAACLTPGRSRRGVATNTGHALAKFRLYRRYPAVPPEILMRIRRLGESDPGFMELLERSLAVLAALSEDHPECREVVVPVAVATTAVSSGAVLPDAEPAADVRAVLDRGRGLAAAYRVARRPVPDPPEAVCVLASVDFLVLFGACAAVLDELRGDGPVAGPASIEPLLPGLVDAARRAVDASARNRRDDEPDVIHELHGVAAFLSADRAARAAGRSPDVARWAFDVCRVLLHPLRLREGAADIPDDGVGERTPAGLPGPADHAAGHVRHLLEWLVLALFEGTGSADHDVLVRWLDGRRAVDDAQGLPLLIRRLAVATERLDGVPDEPASRPDKIGADALERVLDHLELRVDPRDVPGSSVTDVRMLMLAALPPLWTRRAPVVGLLAAQLRVLLGDRYSGPLKALVVASVGARGPVQFVSNTADPVPDPCCAEPRRSSATAEPPADRVCLHRPWGEPGWVETRSSIATEAGTTPEAVRKHLTRYEGPWAELLSGYEGRNGQVRAAQ